MDPSVRESVRGEQHLSIALCTYNGAQYLREQLDSIASQTRLPDELIVCDDRSVDDSVEVVKTFASEAPFPVRVHVNEERLGATKNFEKAIKLCEGDLIALSDQDDVWLPNKLEITLNAMREAADRYGTATPILVHTDLRVIDHEGRFIAPSFHKYQGIRGSHKNPLAELLVENYVTGCTLMVNRALRDAGLPISSKAAATKASHQSCISALGRIVSLPDATVLYRQHSGNVVGAGRGNLRKYVFGWRAFVGRVGRRFLQSEALEEHLREDLDPATRSFLNEYQKRVRAGGFSAVYWLADSGVTMQRTAWTLALYLLLLKRGRFDTDHGEDR